MSASAPDAGLANYRLNRLLGSGGMGSVYLARDLTLDRDVAIKFISPEKAGDEGARKRLIREARAAAALDHPNICAVHQVIVEDSGRACIVMQYVEGETLAEKLRSGPLDPRLAVTIACDLADALAAAHKRGIVHRDIKPQNVIVTGERHAKLLDFGIARITELNAGDAHTRTELTSSGVFVGTPPYASPEQAQQLALDGRSDLFSLGAVLFECLTGRRPFEGRSPMELFTQIVNQHPPAVSAVRPELTDRYDEVCRRLLAKHPDDRFRSAEELLGALRMLAPDTARSGSAEVSPRPASGAGDRWTRRRLALAAAASLIVIAAIGLWTWNQSWLSAVQGDGGNDFYHRGTEYVRDGAYQSGVLAIEKSIELSPTYAPAYLRLAEAHSELDDATAANAALLKALRLLPDRSRLERDERLRVEALHALLTRDLAGAVDAYRRLVDRHPRDAGLWLDLGRAQEAFALTADARASFDKAIQIDPDYAAARLRRASLLAGEGLRAEALREFDVAERLYVAGSNLEGEIETLIRRGAFYNAGGDLTEARRVLERAVTLAERNPSQQIRAHMQLSSVTASEGRFADAETLAATAVQAALDKHLETIAAEGLIELANVLYQRKQVADANVQLTSAITLAEARGASRVAARARIQRAALMLDSSRHKDALAGASASLDFVTRNRYRRYELKARTIIGRAHEGLGNLAGATEMAKQVLAVATEIRDESQMSEALDNLAGAATATGSLPEAVEYRRRAAEIHRKQNDLSALPFDLTNLAELLIRLGRAEEADGVLTEVEAGMAKGLEAFKQRARRTQSLRVLAAATTGRHAEAIGLARQMIAAKPGTDDSYGRLAFRILEYSTVATGGRLTPAPIADTERLASSVARELRYWTLAGYLASGDAKRTADAVAATLADPQANVSAEFNWRIAAIGAAAARRSAPAAAAASAAQASESLEKLRLAWKDAVQRYLARPDLTELQHKAGLNHQS